MRIVTESEAHKYLSALIETACQDREEVLITSPRGNIYLVCAEEYEPLMETHHLLRSPENAHRLFRAHENVIAGRFTEHDLIEE